MELKTVSPRDCGRWDLADRSFDEYGDIFKLANDIKRNGQVEPILVRPIKSNEYKYEVIAGARRWKACLETDQPINVIVQPLSDSQAIIAQIRENEKLKLSDYSKGLSYSKMIDSNHISIADLSSVLGCSKAKLHNYLSFARIPAKILQSIGKKDKISSRSAATILALSKKNAQYTSALIEIAEEISLGAGSSTIEKLVNNIIVGGEQKTEEVLVQNAAGQVLAKWKNGKLHFAKDVELDKKKFNQMIVSFFDADNAN